MKVLVKCYKLFAKLSTSKMQINLKYVSLNRMWPTQHQICSATVLNLFSTKCILWQEIVAALLPSFSVYCRKCKKTHWRPRNFDLNLAKVGTFQFNFFKMRKRNFIAYLRVQSNKCITTTLKTTKLWPLLTGGHYS